MNLVSTDVFSQCGAPVYIPWNGLPSSIYAQGAEVSFQSGGVWRRYRSLWNNNANVPTNTGWWLNLGCCTGPTTAPTANAASNLNCTSFSANWAALAGATGYRIDVNTNNTFTGTAILNNVDVGNVTSRSVTGLAQNTNYFYRIRGYNNCGTGTNSITITATTSAISAIPTANAASNLNCTSFSANWAASVGATGYRLDVNTNNTFTGTWILNNVDVGNVTTRSITGLTPGTNYFYRIRSVNACGTSANSVTITATTLATPAAPISTAASLITCTSFSANWTAVAGATAYFLDVNTNNTFTGTAILNNFNVGNVTTRSITGLTGNTNYFYRVRASNACGSGVASAIITATTSAPTPAAPVANPASHNDCDNFMARWTFSTNATAYFLDVNTNNTFTGTAILNNVNVGNVPTFLVTGLTPNTNYFYRVRANNACGTSGNSSTITTTTTAPIPPVSTTAAATSITCSSFTANWSASAGALGYQLDVNTNNTFTGTALINNVNVGNVTSFSVTGLVANTNYFYRVRPGNTCGFSANSNVTQVTTLAPTPAAPTANAATLPTCTSFTANWTAAAGATTYFLDVNTNNTFTGTVILNNSDVGNVTTFNVTGLLANTNYFYRIRANNACGTSGNSSTITTTTTAPTPAPPVTNGPTLITCNSFTANWTASLGATTYFMDVVNTFTGTTIRNNVNVGNITSINITGLTANTNYFYRIRASNACGTSANSGLITAATTAPTPAAPTANAASLTTCSSFTANWTSAAGATNYFLDVNTNNTFTGTVILNNSDVGNVTTFNVTGLLANTIYFYRVRASNACGTSGNSGTITVTVSPLSVGGTIAGSATVCTGTNSTTFTLSGHTGNVVRWESSLDNFATAGTTIANTTTTLTATNLTATTYYRAVVQSGTCATANSATGTVTVNAITNPGVLGTNQTYCASSLTPLSFVTPATAVGVITYQWQTNTTGCGGSWTDIVGEVTTTYSPSLVTQDTYYRVVVTSTFNGVQCTSVTNCIAITAIIKTWNGSVSSNWGVSNNWTPSGVPTDLDYVIIPPSSNNPVISGTGVNVSACKILIQNNASLTVNASNTIIVNNNVTVLGSGVFQIENNASLIQLNDVPNTGNIIYKRTANVRNYDYVYWSSPVLGMNVSSLISPLNFGPIFKWNPTISNSNGGQGGWVSAASEIMEQSKGYIARAPISFSPSTPQPLHATFTGIPNNGTINYTISRGSDTNTSYHQGTNGLEITNYSDNWNLVGNPYPSAISASKFLFDNSSKIMGTVSLWTHGTLPLSSTLNPFYGSFTYNYSSSDYLVFNFTGTTCCPLLEDDLFIGAGQGFFVQMVDGPAGSDVITFTNSMRNSAYSNSYFYRTNAMNRGMINTIERNRIWLDIVNSSGQSNRTLLGYVEGATNEFDSFFDTHTVVSGDMAIFTTDGDKKYQIQGRELPFNKADEVPIGVNIPESGTYTIAIAAVDGLFNGNDIFIKDELLNTMHNLKNSTYNFTASEGVLDDRFKIVYRDSSYDATIITDEVLITTNDFIEIKSISSPIVEVNVLDILGRKIAMFDNVNENNLKFYLKEKNSILLVKIRLQNGREITKKIKI